jgi:hypothetical protein
MRLEAVQDLDAPPPSGREVFAAARLFHRILRTRLNQCFDQEFALTYAQYEILQILEEQPNLHWISSTSHQGTAGFALPG